MWGSHSTYSGNAQSKSVFGKIFNGSSGLRCADVKAGTPVRTVRGLSKEGYEVYNVGTDVSANIYVAKAPEKAYFEDEEEYAPTIRPISEEVFAQSIYEEAPAVQAKARSFKYTEPVDMFSNARKQPVFEEVDYSQIIIKKRQDISFREVRERTGVPAGPERIAPARQPVIVGMHLEIAKQAAPGATEASAEPEVAAVSAAVDIASAGAQEAAMTSTESDAPMLVAAPGPVAEPEQAYILVNADRDTMVLFFPELEIDELFLGLSKDDSPMVPEDGLEASAAAASLQS
ncbi:hypothetical protein PAA26_02105 [Methanomassiliicoccaceae archaeon COG_1]|nr:hypothetical protein [Methanomassiliicoccaceae archaeon COG_1]